jgi:hypothetical protein
MKDMNDYKQIAFKLQSDIDTLKWEEANKNCPFLKEIKARLEKYASNKDITQLEMVNNMIDHWIEEYEKILNNPS